MKKKITLIKFMQLDTGQFIAVLKQEGNYTKGINLCSPYLAIKNILTSRLSELPKSQEIPGLEELHREPEMAFVFNRYNPLYESASPERIAAVQALVDKNI